MRVAGMAFARLRGPGETYALLLNAGRLKHDGERILSPIGGGLELQPQDRAYLTTRFGVSGFEGQRGSELRCQVPDDRVQQVVRWFEQRGQRETEVWRELSEELVGETHLLTLADLDRYDEQFDHCVRFDDVTKRPVTDKRTAYLIEVFDVSVLPATLTKLYAASRVPLPQRWIYFVTADEIKKGRTQDGVAIGGIARTILAID